MPSRSPPARSEWEPDGAEPSASRATPARSASAGWNPWRPTPGGSTCRYTIEPVPPAIAADRLRRQLARLESGRRADMAKGRLADPEIEVAADDARDLAAGLARGEEKLFRVALTLTVHAGSEKALDAECNRARALCSSLLLDAQPATWRSLQGWVTTLPLGSRRPRGAAQLRYRRPRRVVPVRLCRAVGHHRRPVRHCGQRGRADVLGPFHLRQLQLGHPRPLWRRQVLPGEARNPPQSLRGDRSGGGRPRGRVRPPGPTRSAAPTSTSAPRGCGSTPSTSLPVPSRWSAKPCSSTLSSPSCWASQSAPQAKPALDRAILAAYEHGRDHHRSPHPRSPGTTPAPISPPRSTPTPTRPARHWPARLAPFVTGTHRGLFDGPTTQDPAGHLVVFSPAGPARRAQGCWHAAYVGRGLAAGCRIPTSDAAGWSSSTRRGC